MFGLFKKKDEGDASNAEPTPTEPAEELTETDSEMAKNDLLAQRLEEAGYTLPPVAAPVAAYVPAIAVKDSRGKVIQVQTSGQLPMIDGKLATVGKVGEGAGLVSPSVAYELAKVAALNALAAGADIAGGVDRIHSVSKVTVFVASDGEFTGQAQVANGASEFYGELFDGGHSRSAVGVAVLPLNSPVEVEVIFNVF